MPPASFNKNRTSDGVVVNKMFADYDKDDRESCPDMESYVDDDSCRYSDATVATSRVDSRDVQMGRIISTESRPENSITQSGERIRRNPNGWALM